MKKFVKLSSLFCALVVGFCASAFAWRVDIPCNQVNVQHERNLALQRYRQGILPQGLGNVYKIIHWGHISGTLSIMTMNYQGREVVVYHSDFQPLGEHLQNAAMNNCIIS